MNIYDISQELSNAKVFPGDTAPMLTKQTNMDNGDMYNLTDLTMSLHNGTHIDAPNHFINDGWTISDIPLEVFIGEAKVVELEGDITSTDIKNLNLSDVFRLIIKGNISITKEAALELIEYPLCLIGCEPQSISSDAKAVHDILLGNSIILLEGAVLNDVPVGDYTLFAAPINIKGADGSPVRAILMN